MIFFLKMRCSKIMRLLYKSIQRLAFDNGLRSRKIYFIISFVIFSFYTMIIYKIGKYENENHNELLDNVCYKFDVVYTWVNGSDPKFQELLMKYYRIYLSESSLLQSSLTYDPSRFDDKNELKYSLRSLEKYAPWVRHVYIVTNGQIPYWLDISYDKVTIIQHSQLMNDNNEFNNVLPTFSSSSIETFIHRIPNLSKRFLYLNDDIFLGAQLYPEDLYTESEGVKIYNAWTLPDCAIDCPWVYIGDGSCDNHCNIAECQYDGGDCLFYDDLNNSNNNNNNNNNEINKMLTINNSTIKQKMNNINNSSRNFNSTIINDYRKMFSFNEILKKKNVTDIKEIHKFVEQYNNEKRKLKKRKRIKKYLNFNQDKYNIYNNDYTDSNNNYNKYKILSSLSMSSTSLLKFTSTKDIFSHSLIYTNKLLNKIYGFKTRNVLAHVGFLFDKDIIKEMEKKFSTEIMKTRLNRFRNKNDIQYAFLYYNYLMSETINISISDIFNEFDTDNSLTWSDREIRTVLTRLYPLPLDWSIMHYFEDIIMNCSKQLHLDINPDGPYSTILYERYEDSNIPTVSKYLVSKCWPLADALKMNFGKKSKYKFTINQKRGLQSNFMMLTSNITEVAEGLDKFRYHLKKFNCINDNLEPQYQEENQFIKYLLEDFYLSLFPNPSKYELPSNLRNRFSYLDDYEEWLKYRSITIYSGYIFSLILFLYLLYKYYKNYHNNVVHNKRYRRYLNM